MQRPLAIILVLASLSVTTATRAVESNEAQERAKSKLVSRLYQATYGYSEKCSKATPETAKDFERELSRFVERNSSLMKLVTESVYYEPAQSRFAKNAKVDPANDTPETIAGECKFLVSLMRDMNDTAKGQQSVKEYEAILSK